MLWAKKEDNWRVPVKCWASNIEEGAMQQAAMLAKMPCIFHHVALMPDCHLGYALPVGGVVAYKDSVSPFGVGSDAGCLDCDTEVLTPTGWIRIADYKGEEILQFSPEGNTGCFLKPFAFIKKPCHLFYHLKGDGALDQMVSDEHNLLVYNGKPNNRTFSKMTVQELYSHKAIDHGSYTFNTCFNIINAKGCGLTPALIRVDIMVQADGRIVKEYDNYNGCELHFRKERKIKRARELLTAAAIQFNEYRAKDDSTYFSFHLPKTINKDLTKYFLATSSELEIVKDECLLWDGHEGIRSSFSSTNKQAIDAIQYAFIATDRRASIFTRTDQRGDKKNWKTCYQVIPTQNKYVSYVGFPTIAKSKDGFKYCFTTQTGYFLARRNGYTFLTGNCGMHTFRTNIKAEALSDMSLRREIQNKIKALVPVGESIHDKQQGWEAFNVYQDNGGLDFLVNDRVRKSLGTAGQGNHFVEIDKATFVDSEFRGEDMEMGTEGYVWGLIHTGSRNLGKQLADYYHALAVEQCKKWYSNIPAEEYAFLPIDSDLGQQYLRDMKFALEYALENRRRIAYKMQTVLREFFPDLQICFGYDIHHNYANIENHFGENVWVHRKGATSAKKDEIGIIPGSMGTSSYIVKGLGNPDSFMSCSHGAGRKMSRSAASTTLTEDECNKAMEGIVCERWSRVRRGKAKGQLDLSEAPGAYKDIEEVISNEADLVKPIVRLTPLAVLKG